MSRRSSSAFNGRRYIADSSAWHRASDPRVSTQWAYAIEQQQILTTGPIRLELLYSARNFDELLMLRSSLDALQNIPIDHSAFRRSEEVMEILSEKLDGYHRVSPADLLVACAAERAGVGVLHCDKHYDKLSEVLSFESRWLIKS